MQDLFYFSLFPVLVCSEEPAIKTCNHMDLCVERGLEAGNRRVGVRGVMMCTQTGG